MAKLTNYLFSENAREHANFYVQALGGDIVSIQTYGDVPNTPEHLKDNVLHLHLIAAGVDFYMCDQTSEPVTYGTAINLSLEFAAEEEAHRAFDRLADGGTVLSPLKREFWGSLFGLLQDKYGIRWMITTEANTGESN